MATSISPAQDQKKAHVRVNPFEPSTKTVPPTSLEDSSHIVTIPHIPELYVSVSFSSSLKAWRQSTDHRLEPVKLILPFYHYPGRRLSPKNPIS